MPLSGVKLGMPVAIQSVIKIRNMAVEMRKEAKIKDLIDFTSSKFLQKDYFEVHLDKFISRRHIGDYSFSCSFEWMPSGTIMEHFSVGHKNRELVPNEAQLLAILLGIRNNRKAVQSKRGVCHWFQPIAFKQREKVSEVVFTALQ